MFEKVINEMNTYDRVLRQAYSEFENAKKELPKNYAGEKLEEKLSQATQRFQNIKINELKGYEIAVKKVFDDLFNQIINIVGVAVPNDFASTLEALKSSKGHISDYEAELYANKYRNNYTACKAIISVLHDAGKAKNIEILYADYVKNELSNCLETAMNYAYDYDPESLSTAFFLSRDTNPLLISASKIESFFKNDFFAINK